MAFKELQNIYQRLYFSIKGEMYNSIIFPQKIKEEIESIELRMTEYKDKKNFAERISKIFAKAFEKKIPNKLSVEDIKKTREIIERGLSSAGLRLLPNSVVYSSDDDLEELIMLNTQYENILNNIVVNIVTIFENFIFHFYKSIIKNDNLKIKKEFNVNIEELLSVNDKGIEEVIDIIVNKQAENFIYKGSNDYLLELHKLGFNNEFFNNYKNIINELFARRNIIVHNDCIVNNAYLIKSNNKYNYNNGEKLKTSSEYIEEIGYILISLATILTADQWDKLIYQVNKDKVELKDDAKDLYYSFERVSFLMLQNQKWNFTKYIYKHLTSIDKKNVLEFKEGFRLNYYLSGYHLKDKKILEEIEQYDVKSKSFLFKVGYYAITEKYDLIINEINNYGKRVEDITSIDLATWPVFFNVKEKQQKFDSIIKALKENYEKYS